MWETPTRGGHAWMDDHVSPTFTGFGRSDRSYDRAAIIDLPIDGDIDVDVGAEVDEAGSAVPPEPHAVISQHDAMRNADPRVAVVMRRR